MESMCVSQMGVRFEFEDIIQNIKCQECEISSIFIHFHQVPSNHHPPGGYPCSVSDHYRMALNAQIYKWMDWIGIEISER